MNVKNITLTGSEVAVTSGIYGQNCDIRNDGTEGAATADEYAEELAHRAFWRSEINRLEG